MKDGAHLMSHKFPESAVDFAFLNAPQFLLLTSGLLTPGNSIALKSMILFHFLIQGLSDPAQATGIHVLPLSKGVSQWMSESSLESLSKQAISSLVAIFKYKVHQSNRRLSI